MKDPNFLAVKEREIGLQAAPAYRLNTLTNTVLTNTVLLHRTTPRDIYKINVHLNINKLSPKKILIELNPHRMNSSFSSPRG